MWVCLVLALVLLLLVYYKNRKLRRFAKQFKNGLSSLPILGVTHLFIGSDEDRILAIQMAGRDAIERNGLICVWMAHRLYLVVADADIAQFLLRSCLEKDDIMQMCFQMFIGNGSITAPVHIWRPRRKILIPNFNPKSIKKFVQVFAKESQNTVKEIRDSTSGQQFSIYSYISTYTLLSIYETTLGVKIRQQRVTNQLLEMIAEGINIIVTRGFSPWLYCDFIFKRTSYFRKLKEIINFIHSISSQTLKIKRKLLQETRDFNYNIRSRSDEDHFKPFLEQLIESSGGVLKYSDVELAEEFTVLVVAGTDTSAISICFALLMMARHPEVQEKVHVELKEVFGNSTRLVESEDLFRLKYLELVIKETLRLFPPVPIVMRRVDGDVTLPSNITVPSGCGVVVNIWAVHRNPCYWGSDAEQYRPERFLEPSTHPAKFMPFSHGPRNCAGYQYAMSTVKTVLAMLLREYRLLPSEAESKPLRLKFKLMMKDVDDFKVQLERRKQ